ncbi:hypothetical protein [Halosolutus gelatinilyticus]|uniref:hypothetical protein n=1 Tax=Halosolutus gelatinilyticus TaxID=2931975 RepID=UPI001FF6C5E4|nr:hypothetical protein [Halosolutus gelatinilyticus]
MIAEVRPNEQQSFPSGIYTIDLSSALKLYVHVNDEINVYSDSDRTYVYFGGFPDVIIGARSYHTRPAATITTPADPNDVMKAISAFGSALKTKTADRAFPTLRGHPPAIKLGENLSIPENINESKTGIQIGIPPTLRHIFVITPLAYYLGADLVPSSTPRLTTQSGYSYSLDDRFEPTVDQILKQIFFLDCIVRTEGIIPLSLHERELIEPVLKFDIEEVYKLPIHEQIEKYLEVPSEAIEAYLTKWHLKVNVKPVPKIIEFLPYIADRLASVKVMDELSDANSSTSSQSHTQAIEQFTRSNSIQERGPQDVDIVSDISNKLSIPTIQQSWNGTTFSNINSTTPISSFYNSIGRTPREGPITINLICNDPTMSEEAERVNKVYGNHAELLFEVIVHYNTSKDELQEILSQEGDFCHYIGHIDENGFQCSDGKLDASSLENVGVKAFLLNACQSHSQGISLIEAGSSGGIVTFGDVVNDGAISVGNTIARLLNQGFPLYAALDIAREDHIIAEQYHIVGDGLTTIAQPKMGVPNVCSVDHDSDCVNVRMKTYLSSGNRKGSLFTPHLESADCHYLHPGETNKINSTREEFEEFLDLNDTPIIWNGEVDWSRDILRDGLKKLMDR